MRLFLLMFLPLVISAQAQLPDLQSTFASEEVAGTFVLYDASKDQTLIYNDARANQRFRPASTFKIANALIALDKGKVAGLEEVIPYGGGKEYFTQWEKDMNLRDAMKHSNVAVFHQVARRIGLATMKETLEEWDYGNQDPGKTINERFWLTGPLEISAMEQVSFLRRLIRGELAVKPESIALLKDTLLHAKTGNYTIHAKTGWCGPDDPQIGWWIGWVTRGESIFPFALNIDIKSNSDAPKRLLVGKACLQALKLID